ncbi:UxaA family hydrolase [Planctomicrobium sp. SH661]|uniref:UxaA family hydrolase n=1 Tax=Planctomicrobium sp. SH661 TaxID=3448124 RepID=UPI003F5BB091
MNEIWGYQRTVGPPGIRNHIVCIHTVECASFVSQRIAAIDSRVQSLGFPGCYSNSYASRLMAALGGHPNVGAVLLVSLGCEGTNAGELAEEIRKQGRPVEVLKIQEHGGTESSILRGHEIVKRLIAELESIPRVRMTMADLVVGTECGGSDATSGIAANPAVGTAFDRLVDAGATVLIEETLEMIGCSSIIASRAANPQVARQLALAIDKAERFSLKAEQVSIAPGNHRGGLTTIEEKSMGAFAKCGTRPISGVVKVAESPPGKGLYVLDSVPDESSFSFGYSNPNDSEGILDLISCGAHLVVFTTGRGSVIGSVIAPVLKVCGNPQTFRHMRDDLDINAGRIIHGEASVQEIGDEIFAEIGAVAGGRLTQAERLGHEEYHIPYKFQELCSYA